MCGIVGFSLKKKKINDKLLLESALKVLEHRGPDSSGYFFSRDKLIGFGHTRLSIIDLSKTANQPFIDSNSGLAITFNGEIYNFQKLKNEIIESGYSDFETKSDTEVILKMYLKFGTKMLKKLNGIFSFAIYDPRKELIFIARDHFGVKPLYYKFDDNGFYFSSEIKPLVLLSNKNNDIDYESLDRYLSFLWCPSLGTPIKEIKKFPPGEAMIIRKGRIEEKWKWYIFPSFSPKAKSLLSSTSLVSETQKLLRESVHKQMIADAPLGAFLSGGLDSSAIVAFAREKNPNIRCFTIDSAGGDDVGVMPDLPYAKSVSRFLNVPLDVITIDSKKMANDLEKMVIQLEEPIADPAPLNVFYISQLARENGIKVLLSGSGGDDLFAGYRRHRALIMENFWSWLPIGFREKLSSLPDFFDQRKAFGRKIEKIFSGAAMNNEERLINYFRWIRRPDLNNLYTDDFKSRIGTFDTHKSMTDFLDEIDPKASRLDQMLSLEQRFFLTDHNLMYTDKMSMATGVEVRVPFLDQDLIEFSSKVPDRYKIRGNEGKWILKKAMEPYLPNNIIYRPKTGFGAPIRRWMRSELRGLLGDMLSFENVKKRGFFLPDAVQTLIKNNDSGKIDASYTLFSLISIEIWCQNFIDKPLKELKHNN